MPIVIEEPERRRRYALAMTFCIVPVTLAVVAVAIVIEEQEISMPPTEPLALSIICIIGAIAALVVPTRRPKRWLVATSYGLEINPAILEDSAEDLLEYEWTEVGEIHVRAPMMDPMLVVPVLMEEDERLRLLRSYGGYARSDDGYVELCVPILWPRSGAQLLCELGAARDEASSSPGSEGGC